jgi:DNA-binding GntR family transcriptional regulator
VEPAPLLKRENIADAVANAIRAMIVEGRLRPGERIKEAELAIGLGVSRTPVREALIRLAAEGAVTSRPAVGYSVRPLSIEEFEQLYDIRPLLDPEALRLAGIPSLERLARLEALNHAFAATDDPEAAIRLDDDWHMELLAGCPNRVLIELIENIIVRTRRYELALLRERPNVLRAAGDHEAILDALRQGDLPGACAALKHNMQSGRAPILDWLKTRSVASDRSR